MCLISSSHLNHILESFEPPISCLSEANQCFWHSLFAIFVHYFAQVFLLFGVAFCIHKGSKYSSNWCILQSHQLRLHLAPKCSWECITLLSKIVVFKLDSGVASNTNFKHFCWPLWLVIVAYFSLLVFLQFGASFVPYFLLKVL